MSDKKNVTKVTENEKVMTKYDRKMQRRKEEAERAKKEEIRGMIIGIALVAALAIFVLSFPIRSYLAVNGTYIKVGGEKVTPVEFDVQYNISKSTYIEQMSYYLSMFGMTDTSTLEYQSYNNNMTFGDYFAQMAAESLVEQRAVIAKAKEAGFTYDAAEDLEEMKASMETTAVNEGVSLDEYVQSIYGSLATWDRVKPYLEDALYASVYYNKVMEESMPSDEEIQTEYETNKDMYDSVDYRMTIVEADLPTTAPDGTVEKDEEGNEIEYEPTEEEIAAAMEEAYLKAQEAEKTVAEDGEEYTGVNLSSVSSYISDFLSDENRKAGDTTIVEISESNGYWVVSFGRRYLDETPTHDVRMIYTTTTDGQTILGEWKAGEATEESFQELVKKYDETGAASMGGLYSGLEASGMEEEVEEWLTAERAAGDTVAVTTESGITYVMYYVAASDPAWKLDATSALVTADMTAFMEEAIAGIEIEDPKKNLVYLHIEESTEEAAEEETGESAEEATDDSAEEATEETSSEVEESEFAAE